MLIDTHAHLWWESYQVDLPEVLARAKAVGVEKIVVPGTNIESSVAALALAKKHRSVIYPAVGIHPEELSNKEQRISNIEEVRILVESNRESIVAIGEIGVDMSSEELKVKIKEQKELFRAQCELAITHDLPVIIHTRNSLPETWEVLSSLPTMPRGQFHCFSVDEAVLQTILSAGFYASFCGNIGWSKRVAKLVPLVPDDRLLLETDSPFMKPNERNEPSEVATLATLIAGLRGSTAEAIAKITTDNAKQLYRL